MKAKTFDAVKLMRELRDKLSQELESMTPEERLRHIREKAAASGLASRFPEAEGPVPKPAI